MWRAIADFIGALLFLVVIFFVLIAFLSAPSHANPYPVCEVVVAYDRPSKHEIETHEMTHCWGWTHGVATYAGEFKPPAEYVAKGPYPNVILRRVSTARAKYICRGAVGGGHYGCAMGGLLP